MLGKAHMLIGASAFLTTAGLATELIQGQRLTAPELACGTVIAAGAALLPDLDCPTATISNSLGPYSRGLSRVTCRLAGGHRQGTHSLAALTLTGALLAWSLSTHAAPYIALGAALLSVSLCLKLLTDARPLVCGGLAALVAVAITTIAPASVYLALAVVLGMASHLAADAVTVEGVPLFWPVSRARQRLALVGRTGGWREQAVAAIAGFLSICLLAGALVPCWRAAHQHPAATATSTITLARPRDTSPSRRPASRRGEERRAQP